MLKEQYWHDIISNLGIAISPENDSEIIVKSDVFHDKKSDVYTLSDDYKISYQDYGTLIVDFQNTDFTSKEQFIHFFNSYFLFGMETKKINLVFKEGCCTQVIYTSFMEKMIRKYKKILISYQKDINSILDYCLFNPNKRTTCLTPFERLCMLEYLPNNPSLLQDNHMEVIHLNTLSDMNSPNYTEAELVHKIKNKDFTAYSNSLYIPNNISALLHFELTEVLKENIILRICNYCNKYFIAPNRHITYCSNIAPGYTSRTCKQIARTKKCTENKSKDDALSLFTKVYNNKAYKSSRYKDITDYYVDYKHFQQIGKKKVNAYKSKKITKEEFIDWINRNN